MSKITNRDAMSSLARVVPHLAPEILQQLIRSRGLDACSELVMSATPAQLGSLLDLELWRPARPGHHAQFDVDRFGEWIEVLVEAGHSVAARTVASLDKDLVIAGLSRCVRVFDPGVFEPTAQSDDEPIDRKEAMRGGDSIEVGGYIVQARRADIWDAIAALLVALDAEHGNDFHAVMQGCRRLSNSSPEIDGLDDLLPAPDQHLHDVAIERERRRARQGYATPADARAFLEMARQPKKTRPKALVTAYFREADDAALESSHQPAPLPAPTVHEPLEGVMELLAEAGVMPDRPRALLEASPEPGHGRADRLTRVRRLMAYVRDTDDTAYLARSRELAFLANTLLAGCSVQSRPFTTQEASDAAAGICNLGLECWPARWPGAASAEPPDTNPPDSFLIDHDLVTAFEVGWLVLYQDVSVFAAEQLIATVRALTDAGCVDRDIRHGLVALRHTLVTQRDAGTPWRARAAAEVLAMLDTTAWIGVIGLLDECPVLPAALTAVLEGRTTRVSPTAFDFISTAAQIADVRTFLRKLPGVLLQ